MALLLFWQILAANDRAGIMLSTLRRHSEAVQWGCPFAKPQNILPEPSRGKRKMRPGKCFSSPLSARAEVLRPGPSPAVSTPHSSCLIRSASRRTGGPDWGEPAIRDSERQGHSAFIPPAHQNPQGLGPAAKALRSPTAAQPCGFWASSNPGGANRTPCHPPPWVLMVCKPGDWRRNER
jgi:hypothetical protein